MAKRRIRKKATKKKAKKNMTTTATNKKKRLTKGEMLRRIPDREYLTTPEVRHVFNDCHEVTVYKMVGKGELKAYRTRNRGKANVYRADEVKALVISRFEPVLAPTSRDLEESSASGKKASKVRRSKNS